MPSSRACRASREMPHSPRFALKAPVMQVIQLRTGPGSSLVAGNRSFNADEMLNTVCQKEDAKTKC